MNTAFRPIASENHAHRNLPEPLAIEMNPTSPAAVAGPTFVAQVRQATGHYQGALRVMAVMTLVSAIVPILLYPPVLQPQHAEDESDLARVRRPAVS